MSVDSILGEYMKLSNTLGLLGLIPAMAGATALDFDTAHSSVGFEIKHLVVSTVHGSFTDFAGTIELNEKDFAKSQINFTVKTDSVNTANAKRDGHLKSPDFFDTAKYPEAKFVGRSIKPTGKNKYTLEGDLTIHGQTKATKFVLVNLGKVKDPYGVEKYMFQASTELVRKDFGLVYNATLESGGMVLGDKVKLVIDAEAAAPAPAKPEAGKSS
jgi:polyisoprenoid-binding protein YceI